jgi:hypothetical protein
MYRNLQIRQRELLEDIEDQLVVIMALDPRLIPGVVSELRTVRSSASTPSLRSRDGSVTPGGMREGGNVKVVVRVRGFLPRGMMRSVLELWERC